MYDVVFFCDMTGLELFFVQEIQSLKDAVNIVDSLDDDDFLSVETGKFLIDLSVGECRRANVEILKTHAIPSDRSESLKNLEAAEEEEEEEKVIRKKNDIQSRIQSTTRILER